MIRTPSPASDVGGGLFVSMGGLRSEHVDVSEEDTDKDDEEEEEEEEEGSFVNISPSSPIHYVGGRSVGNNSCRSRSDSVGPSPSRRSPGSRTPISVTASCEEPDDERGGYDRSYRHYKSLQIPEGSKSRSNTPPGPCMKRSKGSQIALAAEEGELFSMPHCFGNNYNATNGYQSRSANSSPRRGFGGDRSRSPSPVPYLRRSADSRLALAAEEGIEALECTELDNDLGYTKPSLHIPCSLHAIPPRGQSRSESPDNTRFVPYLQRSPMCTRSTANIAKVRQLDDQDSTGGWESFHSDSSGSLPIPVPIPVPIPLPSSDTSPTSAAANNIAANTCLLRRSPGSRAALVEGLELNSCSINRRPMNGSTPSVSSLFPLSFKRSHAPWATIRPLDSKSLHNIRSTSTGAATNAGGGSKTAAYMRRCPGSMTDFSKMEGGGILGSMSMHRTSSLHNMSIIDDTTTSQRAFRSARRIDRMKQIDLASNGHKRRKSHVIDAGGKTTTTALFLKVVMGTLVVCLTVPMVFLQRVSSGVLIDFSAFGSTNPRQSLRPVLQLRRTTSGPAPGTLTKKQRHTFTILQLTDFHLDETRWEDWKDEHTNKAIESIEKYIAFENPDLIILTGDQITASFDAKRAKRFYNLFAEKISSHNIPWTLTFGNHDDAVKIKTTTTNDEGETKTTSRYQECDMTRDKLVASDQQYALSLTQRGPHELSGVTNYWLNVHLPDAQASSSSPDVSRTLQQEEAGQEERQVAARLLLLDTGGGALPNNPYQADKVGWYYKNLAHYPEDVPVFVFQHIPPYKHIMYDRDRCYGTGLPKTDDSEYWYKSSYLNQPSEQDLFHALANTTQVQFVAFGHLHYYDYCCRADVPVAPKRQQPLHYCFGRFSGLFPEKWSHGTRVYHLMFDVEEDERLDPSSDSQNRSNRSDKRNNRSSVEFVGWKSHIRLENGDIISEYDPLSASPHLPTVQEQE